MEGHLSSCDVSLCISAFFTGGSDMVIVLVLIVNPKKSICFNGVRTDFGSLVTNPSDANSQMIVAEVVALTVRLRACRPGR